MKVLTLKALSLLVVLLWYADVAVAAEFYFNKTMFKGWVFENYNDRLSFEVKEDHKLHQGYLIITLRKTAPYELTKDKRKATTQEAKTAETPKSRGDQLSLRGKIPIIRGMRCPV